MREMEGGGVAVGGREQKKEERRRTKPSGPLSLLPSSL